MDNESIHSTEVPEDKRREEEKMIEVITSMDSYGGNVISRKELLREMESHGVKDFEWMDMAYELHGMYRTEFRDLDKDGDGLISAEELREYFGMVYTQEDQVEQEMLEFNKFDTDKDGYLNFNEY